MKKENAPGEEELPPNYPNSIYQKIWEMLESQAPPKQKVPRTAKPTVNPEMPESPEADKLATVMSNTPAEPAFGREEVRGIANSLRQTLGKEPVAPKSPRQVEAEDTKIKDQLGTLWEDTGTKPMKPVRKEMIHLYGEPAEPLPETENPPSPFFTKTEPVKKKGKS